MTKIQHLLAWLQDQRDDARDMKASAERLGVEHRVYEARELAMQHALDKARQLFNEH